MTSTLPPDPYKLLGVTKDASLPEIRSAHRKLVLKCHPDKVQDAALKAVKQDEFQKVQQAYELLSDDKKRLQYDEQVKLWDLRREMGRGVATARSNPFEYEIRTAEPRTTSASYPRPVPNPTKVYSSPQPRSYEDVVYEVPLRSTPRKSTSYESTDRKRSSRDDERDRRRQEDEEKSARWWEKESKRATHGEKKKSRDKEKRRATEEKYTRTAYVEDDSEEEFRPQPLRKKSDRRMEEEIRVREEAARAARVTEKQASLLASKWDVHKEYAAQYMHNARQKVQKEEDYPAPLRRADTFEGAAAYNVRYATPTRPDLSDEDSPRRSSGYKKERRSTETPRSREKLSRESRRSPGRDPYIVEPPSPIQKPSLKSHSSAPPIIPNFRKEPSRSKTTDYPRKDSVPVLSRAQTFQSGDRDRGRDRGGSRLKNPVEYTSSDSDSESPVRSKPLYSASPPQIRPVQGQTRYIIDNGRSIPINSRHRSDLDADYIRDRSESPKARPSLLRNNGSSGSSRPIPTRSSSQVYYTPDAPAPPIILTARPKLAPREDSRRSTRSAGVAPGNFFGEVKYAQTYGREDVIYAASPNLTAYHRRGSDPSHRYEYSGQRRSGEAVYAS